MIPHLLISDRHRSHDLDCKVWGVFSAEEEGAG